MQIPDNIKHLRFVRVLAGRKSAFEKEVYNKTLSAADIQPFIDRGENYGVVGGQITGVAMIDADHKEYVMAVENFLPETFSVRSSSDNKRHFYYYIKNFPKDIHKISLINPDDPTTQGGDIRFGNFYVVGPGSIHPDTHMPYRVMTDMPIATIDFEDVDGLLKEYYKKNIFEPSSYKDSDCSISIGNIAKHYNIVLDKKSGDEIFGSHPIHGSTNGTNFSINEAKNVWVCRRCGTGGGVFKLVAMMEGMIECSKMPSKVLPTAIYDKVVDVLVEKFEYNPNNKLEKTLRIAKFICENTTLKYNETSDRLFEYRDNYYQVIKTGNRGSRMHSIIMETPGGMKLKTNERENIIKNVEVLSCEPEISFNNGCLNFNNVIFDTETMSIKEHSSDVICTSRIPYDYDPTATCPNFDEFLKYVMNGDINKIKILQEFIGYCLTNHCRYEKALFMVGGGQNGKGTFTNTILNLFGQDNVSAAGLEDIADPCSRAALINKIVNIDTEVDRRAERFETIFRKIASGEETLYNEKYIQAYSKAVRCKLIFSANKMPRIDESTYGFYRRMLVIPFDVVIPEDRKDVNLKVKLLSELPGILNWALDGYRRLSEQGKFSTTAYMEKELNKLMVDNNPIAQFIEECLEFRFEGKDFGATKSDTYNSYTFWCNKYGYKPFAHRRFSTEFLDLCKNNTIPNARKSGDKREHYWPNLVILSCSEADIKREKWGF